MKMPRPDSESIGWLGTSWLICNFKQRCDSATFQINFEKSQVCSPGMTKVLKSNIS